MLVISNLEPKSRNDIPVNLALEIAKSQIGQLPQQISFTESPAGTYIANIVEDDTTPRNIGVRAFRVVVPQGATSFVRPEATCTVQVLEAVQVITVSALGVPTAAAAVTTTVATENYRFPASQGVDLIGIFVPGDPSDSTGVRSNKPVATVTNSVMNGAALELRRTQRFYRVTLVMAASMVPYIDAISPADFAQAA